MTVFYYIMGSVLTLATLIAGILLKFFPPKNINAWYGFKTKATAKNQDTWIYGHKICANTLLIYSVFSILTFIIVSAINPAFIKERVYLIMIFGFIFAMLGVIITTVITQTKTIKYGKQLK